MKKLINNYNILVSSHWFYFKNRISDFKVRYFVSGKSLYSSQSDPKKKNFSSKFVSTLLNSLNDPKHILINDEESQINIENILFDEYESIFRDKPKNMVAGINTEILGPILSKYTLGKLDIFNRYIDNLYNEQLEILKNEKIKNKYDIILMANIIKSLGKGSILNICLYHFLLVYTYQNTDIDKYYVSIPVSIRIAKKMFSKYINLLKNQYVEKNKISISYTL